MRRKLLAMGVACALGIMSLAGCGNSGETHTTAASSVESTTKESTSKESTTEVKTTEEKTTVEKTTASETTALPSIETTEEPTPSLQMDISEYPNMDGSTANLPMMAEILHRITGISEEEAQSRVGCSTTAYAWMSLVDGASDILLVYEAPEETKKYIEDSHIALEITPVGRDGLVFIKNETNPVTSLTTQQLIDIYTGKITNWKEVGGEDTEIIAFQRVEDSGSQTLFRKLLMKDVEPENAPSTLRPDSMGGLIEGLADYNSSGNAIGYSVYYYASYMYTRPGLAFFDIDGITPEESTISGGEYPFVNEFYVAIRASEPVNSPARRLRDWILSDEGKEAMRDAGYITMP